MRGIRSVSNWFDTTKRTENGGNDDSLYILEIYDIIFHVCNVLLYIISIGCECKSNKKNIRKVCDDGEKPTTRNKKISSF